MKIANILKKHEDVMVLDIEKIKDFTIYDISKYFVRDGINALVITKNKKPYYFFTSTDIIDALVVHHEDMNILKFIEKEPKKLITVTLDDTVFDAYRLLRSVKVHHLLVVDDKGDLVSVLKAEDLIKFLNEIAIKDDLSGLYNKKFFDFILDKYKIEENDIGIIFIDIDNFKEINNKKGEIFGNMVLREIAKILKSSIRDTDYAFRFDGDEYVILAFVPNEVLLKIASRIKDKIKSVNIDGITVKSSIGAAHYPTDSNDIYEVVKIANKRMLEEKG
jgi:diguanylate cyclase (GGDEF)-like protein